MPTSIIRQKFAGSSSPDESPACTRSSRYFRPGLVAVMAVGDEDRLGGHQATDRGMRLLVVDDPEPVLDAQVIGRHQRSAVAQARLDGAQHLAVGVGIEPEDRAEVESGRVVEGQAVGLGARERLLVRVDLPLAERLEPHPGQESLARMRLALDLEGLLVDVERDVVFLAEHALAQPVLQEPGGTCVAAMNSVSPGSSRFSSSRMTL